MPALTWPPLLYLFVLALHVALPGRWVDGYVKGADGRPLRYHLNGLLVFFATVASWALACRLGLLRWDAFWVNRWALVASACVSGLVFTFAIVLSAPRVAGWSYLGEILMAVGITLALGRPAEWAPWLYPIYYVVLLVPRQADDDRRCAAKYGDLWERYRQRVPWRIVPYVY